MRRALRWIWPITIVAAWIALVATGRDARTVLAEPLLAIQGSPWFAAGLVVAYLVRAVVLLPATLLSVAAGFALGPVWGWAIGSVGATSSALLAFGLARGIGPARASGVGERFGGLRKRLQGNAFAATLFARLALLPGDVVNVVAGSTGVGWRPFVAATALGGGPGMLAAVLAGASLQGAFDAGNVRIDPAPLLASIGLAVATAVVAAWLRRRGTT